MSPRATLSRPHARFLLFTVLLVCAVTLMRAGSMREDPAELQFVPTSTYPYPDQVPTARPEGRADCRQRPLDPQSPSPKQQPIDPEGTGHPESDAARVREGPPTRGYPSTYGVRLLELLFSSRATDVRMALVCGTWDALDGHQDRLLELLEHRDQGIRAHAVGALRMFQHEERIRNAVFEKYGDTTDRVLKIEIAGWWFGGFAGQSEDPDWKLATEFLERLWNFEQDSSMRIEILMAFCRLGPEFPTQAIRVLRRMTASLSPDEENMFRSREPKVAALINEIVGS